MKIITLSIEDEIPGKSPVPETRVRVRGPLPDKHALDEFNAALEALDLNRIQRDAPLETSQARLQERLSALQGAFMDDRIATTARQEMEQSLLAKQLLCTLVQQIQPRHEVAGHLGLRTLSRLGLVHLTRGFWHVTDLGIEVAWQARILPRES